MDSHFFLSLEDVLNWDDIQLEGTAYDKICKIHIDFWLTTILYE